MAEELPVLITAVTAPVARELAEAAREGRDVWVPLEREATQDGMHVLEVYTSDQDAPVRLLAEPLGMGNERGSAIRLHPWPSPPPRTVGEGTRLADGRFELLSLLGQGSIGAVYRARHTGLNRLVAVKVLHEAFQRDSEFGERFYAEALAMSRLNHTNLIAVHDFGQEPDGLLYIAMPYLEGRTLREIQQRERTFDIPRIVAWMLQVCAGLGHAHARGFIHRDVKPDNLMVVTTEDDDGQPTETIKVLDFGFAVPPSVSGEVAQRLAGTPVYMSPEQCRGEELDARSDLYACGIMMYELATGTVPFLARDGASLRELHKYAPVPLVAEKRPDIDPRYERIVQRALSKNRDERQADMIELRAELKGLLLPESTPSLREPPSPPPPSYAEGPPSSRATREAAAPAPPAPAEDDWLERGTGYEVSAVAPAKALADKLARDASAWLSELSRERNARAFVHRALELDGAVRQLAERGDARTLSRVSVVVAGLVEQSQHRNDAAQQALAAVSRLFVNPDVLTPVAARLLAHGEHDPHRDAAVSLITAARISGAVALYSARAKVAAAAAGRITFVTTMKSLGPAARPVLRAALERIIEQAARGQSGRGMLELAEDLLLGMPKGEDEHAGELAARFAMSKAPGVARAAARALPRVWGDRARSVLLHLVGHEDDSVCLAGIVGLHELDAVDLEAVTRIAAQVTAGRARTPQLHAAFTTALRSATTSAQGQAQAVLRHLAR